MKTAEEILKSMYLKYHGYEMPFIPPYIIEAMKEYAQQFQANNNVYYPEEFVRWMLQSVIHTPYSDKNYILLDQD